MGSLHIHSPPALTHEVRTLDCPTCAAPRQMVGRLYEWYGWSMTCLGCGDSWQDGEMCPRPFAPGWRKRSIQAALRDLAGAGVTQ